ncbi:hypothetical protein GF324_11295 [bacterium]|nr:hypothetical protein [bacterium]
METLLGRAGLRISHDYVRLQQSAYPAADAAFLKLESINEMNLPVFAVHDAVTGGITSKTQGLGLFGPVSLEHFDRVEAFFFARHAAPKLVINPMAHSSLLDILHERSYERSGFTTWLLRGQDTTLPSVKLPVGYTLSRVGEHEFVDVAYVISSAFTQLGVIPPPPELLALHTLLMKMEDAQFYKVEHCGHIIGGAGWVMREKTANLLGCAILPRHRRKGLQQALIHRRTEDAFDKGVENCLLGSLPGGTSQRNAERMGYRALFTNLHVERPVDSVMLQPAG